MIINESGMLFGPFQDSEIYHIEASSLYKKIGSGIRTVELVLYREKKSIFFIEAKSSSPQPGSIDAVRFDEFIQEISDKFIHAFNLYDSAIWKRHEDSCDIPESFKQIDNSTVSIKFCLIIKGHNKEWLPPISEALNRKLSAHATIWGSKITVMNDEMAIKYKLVNRVM